MSNRIAFLCHPYHRGGVTSWMASAALECSRLGYATYFITVNPRKQFISSEGRPTILKLLNEVDNSIKVCAPYVGFEYELGIEEYRADLFKKIIVDKLPLGTPIIVSDDPSVWKAAASVANHYPMIGVLHSDEELYYKLAITYKPFLSKLFVVSNRIAKNLSNRDIDFINKIDLVPCGIETKRFLRSTEKPSDKLNIIWVGRIEERQKRVSDIPKIAHKLKLQNIPFMLQVLGGGSQFDWLNEKLKEDNLTDSVKLHGWVDSKNIAGYFHDADVLLQTSNFEGMSVAAMEALAAGCCVVSSRVSGVEDYENNSLAKDSIFVYSIGDIDEAVSHLIKVSKIPSSTKSHRNTQLANIEFSINGCISKYLKVMESATIVNKSLKLNNNIGVKIKSFLLASGRKLNFEMNNIITKQ